MFFGNITHLGYAQAEGGTAGRPPRQDQEKWNSSKAMTAGTVCR